MKQYLVVIPFIHTEAQGNELEYAIRGWFKHFRDPFHLVVIGDVHPFVLENLHLITFIPKTRVLEVPGQYRPHLDHVAKMLRICEHYKGRFDGFIQAADDCYAINDFTAKDVLIPKAGGYDIPPGDIDDENGFWRDMEKTRRRLVECGLGTLDWETHAPRFYKFDEYAELAAEHDLTNQSYVVENLYFNTYYQGSHPLILTPENRFIQRLESKHQMIDSRKIWLSNSVYGWSPNLESFLKNHFEQ